MQDPQHLVQEIEFAESRTERVSKGEKLCDRDALQRAERCELISIQRRPSAYLSSDKYTWQIDLTP